MIYVFSLILSQNVGIYDPVYSTIASSFLASTIFTLRNNLFKNLDHFDIVTSMIVYTAYTFLITLIGCMMQVFCTETVRELFIYRKNNFIDMSVESKKEILDKTKVIGEIRHNAITGIGNIVKRK